MLGDDSERFPHILHLAERELAVYLQATRDVVGYGDPLRSGSIWLVAMGLLRWPQEGHEQFFRRVTIFAICRLVGHVEFDSSSEEEVCHS